ncbi:hypothetical protein ES703_07695 [subsurface metagenome]
MKVCGFGTSHLANSMRWDVRSRSISADLTSRSNWNILSKRLRRQDWMLVLFLLTGKLTALLSLMKPTLLQSDVDAVAKTSVISMILQSFKKCFANSDASYSVNFMPNQLNLISPKRWLATMEFIRTVGTAVGMITTNTTSMGSPAGSTSGQSIESGIMNFPKAVIRSPCR